MTSIGIVGLDSSHPESFADRLTTLSSVSLEAVWDGGDVRSEAYVDEFCDRYDATRYDSVEPMATEVDGVLILTVNWDRHAALSRPFFEADRAVLIDKPIAGRLEDIHTIQQMATKNQLFGGSMHPFHPKLESWPRDIEDRVIYGIGSNDPFYYGIHVTDTIRYLCGSHWQTVTPSTSDANRVEIAFENGAQAMIQLGAQITDSLSICLDLTDRERIARPGGNEAHHRAMEDRYLMTFLELIDGSSSGTQPQATPVTERILNGATLHLAVHAALESGTEIGPGDQVLAKHHEDGAAFVRKYAR